MGTNSSATAMLAYIRAEVPCLFPAASFQRQPMDNAAVYEAYIYTCVVEALELLKRHCPKERIRWELKSPPTAPNTLLLRKKACGIGPAEGKYSYVRISTSRGEYELHTDVPVKGKSNVANELDVVLLKAEACDAIRNGVVTTPRPFDVVMLVEAKCYSNSLELGIGRAFLGLHHSEFGGQPVGYLASTADNERIQKMVGYHGKRSRPFWPGMNELAARRTAFIQDLERQLANAIIPGRSVRKMSPKPGQPHQPPLPQFE